MTSETMVRDRRSTTLAAVIGTVLASYAGSAAAIEFEFDNGAQAQLEHHDFRGLELARRTIRAACSTRAADGSLLGMYSGPRPRAPASGRATASPATRRRASAT